MDKKNPYYEFFYDYLIKMLSIAKIGLTFSYDAYAIEDYKKVQQLSEDAFEHFMNLKFDRPNYFERNIYPTPNVSVRVIVLNENRDEILLVQEKKDMGYSIPGGWADLYDSPKQAAIREVKEEAGVEVEIVKFAGAISCLPIKDNVFVPEYALIFEGKLVKDFHTHDHEIASVGFFKLDNLPKLSHKMTQENFNKALDAIINNKVIIE